jgi:phosphoserine aminotransferase
MKKHNFSAGPSILPDSVFKEASKAVIDFNGSGLSILEMSHRSKDFVAVMDQARSVSLELLGLENKGYQALFLQSGASMQFTMLAQNLLEKKAAYLNTGTWANNAIKEARFFGEVVEVASSKDKNYNYIPKNYEIPEDVDYFHCTSNNTIFGTQIKAFPKTSVPMICDMSSDIFSRAIDYSQFDLLYAGAQKNMGPAGTTLVIIKESILGKVSRAIPNILNYASHIEKESMYNTPSVFAVYVSMLTLKWLKAKGGVAAMEAQNIKKADLLYNEIDRNSLFEGFVSRLDDRSFMNATFNLTEESSREQFESLLKEAGIIGLNGHRSVGGYRASIYNAMPIESVAVLVEVMQELENRV